MQVIRTSSRAELITVWLKSEWDAPPTREADRRLVDEPDLNDPAENATRQQLLYRDRKIILEKVPEPTEYLVMQLDAADLPKLHVMTCLEWYLDTGGTFRLSDTVTNLARGRQFRHGPIHQPIDHLTAVDALAPKLLAYETTTEENLIIIAADAAGPYSIIDGNHRAAALYRNHLTQPNTPWRAIMAVGPAMAHCSWYIRSEMSKQNIAQLRLLNDLGALR